MTDQPTGTPLPTVDQGATLADQTVQQIIQATEKPVEAAIIVAAPVMGTPIWVNAWETALDYVYSMISGVSGRLTGYVFVDVQQLFALRNAATQLAALHAAQQSGDQNAIAQANAQTDAAVTPILQYIGTS
jgi:hypothetical protein